MSRYNWVTSNLTILEVPPKAVIGGHDTDGDVIYVGRAKHAKCLLPAKIIPQKNAAFVSLNGKAVQVDKAEYLCENDIRCRWVPGNNGKVPPNAILAGKTDKDEPLYVGRVSLKGSLMPGKIQSSHECLFYALGAKEHKSKEYEVLVTEHNWIKVALTDSPPEVPENAVLAGNNEDGTANYVARAAHAGDVMVAKFTPAKNEAFVTYEGVAIKVREIEVLCEITMGCKWVNDEEYFIPPNAISTGTTADNETLYIGRITFNLSLVPGKIQPSHCCMYVEHGNKEHKIVEFEVLTKYKKPIWYSCSTDSSFPENAILAGYDIDNTAMYVGRAVHGTHLLPAKVMPKKRAVCVSFDGGEYRKKCFEVLCHGNFGWERSGLGAIPQNAVLGGRADSGEPLYIGRTRHKNSVTVGKIIPTKKCLVITFDGEEIEYQRYEILVDLA